MRLEIRDDAFRIFYIKMGQRNWYLPNDEKGPLNVYDPFLQNGVQYNEHVLFFPIPNRNFETPLVCYVLFFKKSIKDMIHWLACKYMELEDISADTAFVD